MSYIEFIDKNGLVKTRREQEDTGNGVLYTAILFVFDWYQVGFGPILKCWFKKGVLMRTPGNTYGQEGWDNYLGLVMLLIEMKETRYARNIYFHYWTHLGFFCNQPISRKAWLARSAHLWWLYFAASFPCLKWLVYPQLRICQSFMKGGKQGGGGLMLEWCFMVSFRALYGDNKKLESWKKSVDLEAAFLDQCDPDHPFIEYARDWK